MSSTQTKQTDRQSGKQVKRGSLIKIYRHHLRGKCIPTIVNTMHSAKRKNAWVFRSACACPADLKLTAMFLIG